MSLKGTVGFEAGGQRYTLVFDMNVIVPLEDELNLDSIQIVARTSTTNRMGFLRTMLRAGLQRHHAGTTDEQAGVLMSELTGGITREKILAALAVGFPKAEAGAADGDPPKPGAGGTGPVSSAPGAVSA